MAVLGSKNGVGRRDEFHRYIVRSYIMSYGIFFDFTLTSVLLHLLTSTFIAEWTVYLFHRKKKLSETTEHVLSFFLSMSVQLNSFTWRFQFTTLRLTSGSSRLIRTFTVYCEVTILIRVSLCYGKQSISIVKYNN